MDGNTGVGETEIELQIQNANNLNGFNKQGQTNIRE